MQTVRSGVIYAVGSFSAQMCPASLGCAPIGEVYVLLIIIIIIITAFQYRNNRHNGDK